MTPRLITIDPNSNLDNPSTRADALWAAVGSLQAENMRAGSRSKKRTTSYDE